MSAEAAPRLPSAPLELGGNIYNLCVDLGALAAAEEHFGAQGHTELNLITSLPFVAEQLHALFEVFICSLHAFHPELSYEESRRLLTLGNYLSVVAAINRAWSAVSAETEELNKNLCCDLDVLTIAAEHFARAGNRVPVATLMNGLSLSAVRSIFPCAVHKYRPDLSFSAAQKLMNLRSVYAIGMGFSNAWQVASPAMRNKFSLRMADPSSWTGIAHA